MFFIVSTFAVSILSCKKESISVDNTLNNATTNRVTAGTLQTLDLRPGAQDGQDAHVAWKADDPNWAETGNWGSFEELTPFIWTNNGALVKARVYINFIGLSVIPKNAAVVSAKLILYGLSSSLTAPQGNSTYPGSPYNIYGTNKCVVTQVTSKWDESTITWNKQPNYITNDAVAFGPSTSQFNWDAEVDVTKMVKRMVKYPSQNFGFAISLIKEDIYRSLVFGSSEAADVNDRPRLVVEYTL